MNRMMILSLFIALSVPAVAQEPGQAAGQAHHSAAHRCGRQPGTGNDFRHGRCRAGDRAMPFTPISVRKSVMSLRGASGWRSKASPRANWAGRKLPGHPRPGASFGSVGECAGQADQHLDRRQGQAAADPESAQLDQHIHRPVQCRVGGTVIGSIVTR